MPSQPAIPIKVSSSDTQIVVSYGSVLPSINGADIISLELQMDDGMGGNYTSLTGFDSNNMATQYTASNLVKGLQYNFRYRAKNINGWSDFSSSLLIIAAS